jgi:hypothetical protein
MGLFFGGGGLGLKVPHPRYLLAALACECLSERINGSGTESHVPKRGRILFYISSHGNTK